MRKWIAEDIPGFKPCHRIIISGTTVLEIDLNSGWEIKEVQFDDSVRAPELNELVVTFKKKEKENE